MNRKEKSLQPGEAIVTEIRERALNLYQTRQMLCTEVVVSLNYGLGGGLSEASVKIHD